MRRVIIVLGMLGLAQSAMAADLGYSLPAFAAPICPWGGVYGGGQVGYSTAHVGFTNSVTAMLADMLRDLAIEQDQHISHWPLLPSRNPNDATYGGFVGYNWQWEDAVAGIEVNYNHSSLFGSASDSIERTFFDSTGLPAGHHYFYDVTVTGAASARVTDWGTLRLRGGWAAGQFLPYGFVGFAAGLVDVSRSATVSGSAQDQPDPASPPLTPLPNLLVFDARTDSPRGVAAYGAAAGLGVDVALLPHLFLRAEWEYVQFWPIDGIRIDINTVRTALGFKF